MKFSKIIYPECPHCKILINQLEIFTLEDISHPGKLYVSHKTCPNPKCGKEFYMSTQVELIAEVEDW